jgi:hypothetical protein
VRFFIGIVLAAGAALNGQENAPTGVVRGELVEITPGAGTLKLKTTTGTVYRCGFDSHTYMERDHLRIWPGALRARDHVELIADRKGGNCYARTLRVFELRSSAARSRLPVRPFRTLDHIYPRGNLTFGGVVLRFSPTVLVLRTRTEPEKLVLLRDDTRYLESGLPADFSRLAVNTRVFVRGGKNIENDLEAYQVIWGEIPGPKRDR